MKIIKYSDSWISECSVSVRLSKRSRNPKTVIYVSGEPRPEDIDPEWTQERMEELYKDDECYKRGSKIWKEYNKRVKEIICKAITSSLDLISHELNENHIPHSDLSKYKIVFDRKAGCGCSPGWRLKEDNKVLNLSSKFYWNDVRIVVNLETEAQKSARQAIALEREREEVRTSIEEKRREIDALTDKLHQLEEATTE